MSNCEKLDQIAEYSFFELTLLSILCSPYAAFSLVQNSEGSRLKINTIEGKILI